MKLLSRLSLMAFWIVLPLNAVFSQQKLIVNTIIDDTFDEMSLQRLNQAKVVLEKVFNSAEFAAEVLKTDFPVGDHGLTNAEILEIIRSGMDNYIGKPKDYSMDLRLSVYDKYAGGGEFGVTNMESRITRTHRCYIQQNDVLCYVSHLAHEYMHQIGFYDEKTGLFGRKTKSVPYKIGNIVDSLIKNPQNCYAKHSTCKK